MVGGGHGPAVPVGPQLLAVAIQDPQVAGRGRDGKDGHLHLEAGLPEL